MLRAFLWIFTFLFLVTTTDVNANSCSPTNYNIIVKGGSSLPNDEIISRHNVTSSDVMLGCHTHCQDEEKCVGFNYRTTKNVENCQLTNVTINRANSNQGDWILMHDDDAVCCREEVIICHNGESFRHDNGCKNALGIENGYICDDQITASSEWSTKNRAANARLNFTPRDGRTGAWSSRDKDLHQWLQVDFRRLTQITAISTQGRVDNKKTQFVMSYSVSFSKDGDFFQVYKTEQTEKKFQGNNDSSSIVHQLLIPPISARFIRLRPTAWNDHISMRVEFYGCS
ncbi:lactadherin-like [Dendronephthya gigantea]|uniref:lactadherin-like n=1 Tax=Dendronephthya gigantea TaxID=151771 RepID=UPI001069B6FD|nr:lactadherin-like [Dendronephthya gigantea]